MIVLVSNAYYTACAGVESCAGLPKPELTGLFIPDLACATGSWIVSMDGKQNVNVARLTRTSYSYKDCRAGIGSYNGELETLESYLVYSQHVKSRV